jgi:hypothetical protein
MIIYKVTNCPFKLNIISLIRKFKNYLNLYPMKNNEFSGLSGMM